MDALSEVAACLTMIGTSRLLLNTHLTKFALIRPQPTSCKARLEHAAAHSDAGCKQCASTSSNTPIGRDPKYPPAPSCVLWGQVGAGGMAAS
jgi:hypothetical protein